MGILLGPFDPLQMMFNILNALMKKGLINYQESREILKASMDANMADDEKEKILDSLIKRT
jgi:hypothetical protein